MNIIYYHFLEELTWQALSDVEFTDVYLEELDAYYWMPAFGPAVLASEGKDFYITGYMIPVGSHQWGSNQPSRWSSSAGLQAVNGAAGVGSGKEYDT